MSRPITWQNIAAPSFADASRGLALAQQGINSGFDSFNNVIKQQTDVENANWEQVKRNNTDAFMSRLLQAQGAEGFKALQDSGELQRMLAANGAQIDQAAARTAMDGRMATLQQRDLAGMQYQKAVEENAQDPVVRQIQMLSLKDPAAAQALLDQNPNLRRGFEVAQGIDTRQQVIKDRVWNEKKQQWETAEEAQRVVLRPLEVAAKQAGIESSRASTAASRASTAVSGLNLERLRREATDSDEVRRLDNTLAVAQQQYQQTRADTARNMGIVAKDLGLPVTAAGTPNFDLFTKEDVAKFDTAARTLKTVKIPTASDFMTGDTQAANKFFDQLAGSGEFRAATLRKFKEQIRSGFDSTAGNGSVGNDARNKAVATAQEDVINQERMNNNWYAPNHPQARKSYEELAKEVPGLINKQSGFGTEKDVAAIQKLIYEMATTGIDVGNGKFMTPSVEDVRNAVRTAKGNRFGWSDEVRADNVREILEKNAKSSRVAGQLAESEDLLRWQRRQAVNKLLGGEKP